MVTDNRRSHRIGQGTDIERVMREVVARVQDAGFALKSGGGKHPSWNYVHHWRDRRTRASRGCGSWTA